MRLISYMEEKALKVDKKFVRKVLKKLTPVLAGKTTTSAQAAKKLNDEFVRYGVFFVPGDHETKAADTDLAAGGILSAAALKNGRIVVQYDPDLLWYVMMDEGGWFSFMAAAEKTIEHELVHRAQSNRMSTKALKALKGQDPTELKRYLSNKYEQMAFACQAVTELSMYGYDKKKILDALRNPSTPTPSFTLSMYSEHFNPGDKPFKRFMKYAYWYAVGDVKSISREEKGTND